MMMIRLCIVLAACMVLVPATAYGHGLDLDHIRSIDVQGTDITVSVAMSPDVGPGDERRLTLVATEDDTRNNARNVTFLIGMFDGGKMLLRDYFFAPDGILHIDIAPSQGNLEIHGEQDDILRAWHGTESDPVLITGSIFDSGGLYTFEIELRTIDEPTNIIDDSRTYHADLSIVDDATHVAADAHGDAVKFGTKSYFDGVSGFGYDSQTGQVTISMPFDWSESVMSHIPVLHVEVSFPDDFEEFVSPGYTGVANGIKLFKSSVIIDDYTAADDSRIVHIILLQDHLRFIKNSMKKSGEPFPDTITFVISSNPNLAFPLSAYTKSEDFLLNLAWEPAEPEPDIATTFVFTIRDGATGEPLRNSEYTFVVVQNGQEIHRTSGLAQIGGHFEKFTFGEEQTGPAIIRFENIRNTGQETEFGLVVVPEFGPVILLVLTASIAGVIAASRRVGCVVS